MAEIIPSPDHKKSFGKITREKISRTLRTSHDIVRETAQNVFELLSDALKDVKDVRTESEFLIPILVEYALYAADDTGRDLGEVCRGIFQGVTKTAQELKLELNDILEKAARAMLLESDWRDIDLRIVIESYFKKSVPDGKQLLKKIFLSEKIPGTLPKAA